MILILALFLSSTEPSLCAYDRTAMLALGQQEFDQNESNGWRKLASAGCDHEAANLIRDWRVENNANAKILFWHEGQMRANAGEDIEAIKLFEQSRKTEAEDAVWGWNFYVDGSIAYLKGNIIDLQSARQRLAALPKPPSLTMVDTEGNPVEIEWPMNLNVLDAFIRCWGQTYKQAYACPPKVK